MNQPQVYACPLPRESPSRLSPHPTHLGCHNALGRTLCITQWMLTCICFKCGNVAFPGYSLLHPQVSTRLFALCASPRLPYSWGPRAKNARLAYTTEKENTAFEAEWKQHFVPWVLQVYHLCFNFTTLQDSYPCFSIPQMRKQTQRVQVMCQGHTAKFESQDSMFPPWPSFLPHTLIAFPVAKRVPLGNQCWFDEKLNACRSLLTTYCWESLPAWLHRPHCLRPMESRFPLFCNRTFLHNSTLLLLVVFFGFWVFFWSHPTACRALVP